MQSKVNPELEGAYQVFYTRPQDGFSLKSKVKNKIEERAEKNTTPVKKTTERKRGLIQGRRLFSTDDDDKPAAAEPSSPPRWN